MKQLVLYETSLNQSETSFNQLKSSGAFVMDKEVELWFFIGMWGIVHYR